MPQTSCFYWLSSEVWGQIAEEVSHRYPLETGGVLLGYWSAREEPVITEMIGPGPKAYHGRYRFEPDYRHHETEINRRIAACSHRLSYLGDWHSHPGGHATLSPRDKRTLRRIARHKPAQVARPIMAIIATDGICVWQYVRTIRRVWRRIIAVERLECAD
ncbi:MAG TPA: Mov34/MPN/PAD-1 family protein [Tepidisphaeraceae bacterium]|jgi:integrative and conjugative element protein (TIGR02256 family)